MDIKEFREEILTWIDAMPNKKDCYIEELRDKIATKVIPIEPLVMRTNMEYWCEECETICAVYEQGLSCSCDNRWGTEELDPEDYPKKWKKVKVNICSA